MSYIYRLFILSLALHTSLISDKMTEASSVAKNGTTAKEHDSEIFSRHSIPRQMRTHQRHNHHSSRKKREKTTETTSVLKNGSTSGTLQREILNLLGLPRRPQLSLNTRLHGRKMSAPRYMIDLYHSLESNVSLSTDGLFCCNDSVTDSRALGADTIMSYLNHVRGARPKISKRHSTFRFKMETPQGEKITAAEFRIYKEPISNGHRVVSWENSTYEVKIYQVIEPARILKVLGKRVLRSWESGWQAFDITRAGQEWAQEINKNYGIELSVHTYAGVELNASSVGFVGFHGPQEKRPFLVSFYRQDGEQKLTYHRIFNPHPRRRRSARSLGPQFTNVGGNFKTSSQTSCSRRMLYVSFQRLGWQDWIIAPEGYSAFFCYGECSFPLSAHMNATNHAIVQTLVHLMNPTVVPQPCCSPTKLSAISVLYFDDSNNVVLKKYTNMVVKACGCH